jgi:hypothetical protein
MPRSSAELFKENTDKAIVLVPFTNIPGGTEYDSWGPVEISYQ